MWITLFGKGVQRNHIGQTGETDKFPVGPVADGIDSPGAQIIPDDFHPAFFPVLPKGRLQILHAVVEEIICFPPAAAVAVCRPVSGIRSRSGFRGISGLLFLPGCFLRFFPPGSLQISLPHLLFHEGKYGAKAGSLSGIDAVKSRRKKGVSFRVSQPVSAVFPLHMKPARFPEFFFTQPP